MTKNFENQITISEHATDELSVCIAVSLQMDKETLEKDFKNWGFIYLDEDGKPFTAHTTNLVPLIVVGEEFKGKKLRDGGILADIAPTMLQILGLPQPKEMTGKSLIK